MAELLGWGAGGMQARKIEQQNDAALELDRIAAMTAASAEQRKAEEAEREAALAEKMSTLFSGQDAPAGGSVPIASDNPADQLERAGQLAFAGGNADLGRKLFTSASEYRSDMARIASTDLQTRTRAAELKLKQADVLYSIAQGAQSQEDWVRRIELGVADKVFSPEEGEALAALPFNDTTREMLFEQALTAKDSADLEIRRASEEADNMYRMDRIAQEDERIELERQRTEETRRHNQETEKHRGTTGAGAPTDNEIDIAKMSIISTVFEGAGAADLSDSQKLAIANGAADIAARAKEKVRNTPGLLFPQAVNQAVAESIAAGDWNTSDPWFREASATFDASGRDSQNAIPPPTRPDGTVDLSKLKVGRYYIGKDGTHGRWDGTQMVIE